MRNAFALAPHLRVLALALLLGPAPATAAPRLVLDGLSFFSFEGSSASAFLPAGAEIRLEVEAAGPARWTLRVRPESFDFPPVRYPSGRSVRWRLGSAAVGTIELQGDVASITLTAPLVAEPSGSEAKIAFPLVFTTAQSRRESDGVTAEREGAKLDLASGYVQLVATGLNPSNASTAPGKPFVAVLSGVMIDLPTGLKAP